MVVKFKDVPDYSLHVRLGEGASVAAKMTVLMFCVDFVKEKVGVMKMDNKETDLWFDDDNRTTYEEVLSAKIEEILIKRKGEENPFTDNLMRDLKGEDMIYLN